jgi:hypothetical protein
MISVYFFDTVKCLTQNTLICPLDIVAVRRAFIFSLHLILYMIIQTKRKLLKMDDVSSSLPFLKPGLQTPGANKMLRSDSDEGIESNS